MFVTGKRMWTMMKQILKKLSKNKKNNAAERSSDAGLSGFVVFQVTKSTRIFYVI